jgi:multisubunit Na+/H+ antiporter MnhE subunit
MDRILAPIAIGFVGLVVGIVLDWVGIFLLVQTMDDSLTGADVTIYQLFFGLITAVGVLAAGLSSLGLASWWRYSPAGSLFAALLLCGLIYAILAAPVSVMNDCAVGLAWPVTSIGGCD